MSLQCCNSYVNHSGFIHPAINLSPGGAAALFMNLNVAELLRLVCRFLSFGYIVLRVYERDIFQHFSADLLSLFVSYACFSLCPPVHMRHERNRDLLHHRCPGSGLTYPLQSVLCMKSQALGLNWLCNSSFDLISHLVGGRGDAMNTVEWHSVGHNTPDGGVRVTGVIPPPNTDLFGLRWRKWSQNHSWHWYSPLFVYSVISKQ